MANRTNLTTLRVISVFLVVLALAISTIATQVTSAALIVSIERRNSFNTYPQIAAPLDEGALVFVDRATRYRMIPPSLVGADYVMVANDDKAEPFYELHVMLSQPTILYLLLDNRMGHGSMFGESGYLLDPDLHAAGMGWVSFMGFADTGEDIAIDEGGGGTIERWSSIYALPVGAGTVTLFQQYDVTHQQSRNMYGVAAATAPGRTIYVDADAGGSNNGSSWTNAYRYLQNGLAVAWSGDEIRVAEGIYKPDEDSAHPNGTGSRTATFRLKNGVAVKGGYAGFGQPDPDARDIELYETILSGDIGIVGNKWDNSYHVVTGSWTNETAILDGFTITGGNANGGGNNDNGGGMFNWYGSPTLINCTFSDNSAGFCGGGMFSYSEISPLLTNCTFINNSSMYGGGIYNGTFDWDTSRLTLINCTFKENCAAENGGAIDNSANTFSTIVNCIFTGNVAGQLGGGISSWINSRQTLTNCTFSGNSAGNNGGGMYNNQSSPTLTNCTFSNNSAFWGGGMNNYQSSPTLTNCTFTGNSAFGDTYSKGGGIISTSSCNPTLTNCRFFSNSAGWSGGAVASDFNCDTIITNSLFIGNTAVYGGAIDLWDNSTTRLYNCTVVANDAYNGGGMIAPTANNLLLHNCIVWANTDSSGSGESAQIHGQGGAIGVNYSCIQGWTGTLDGTGNIDEDPLFMDADGADNIVGTPDDNLRLLPGSPCIDAGDSSAVPPSVLTDLDGNPRIAGGTVDMGVYELWFPLILYVDADAPTGGDGSSWADAYNDLQDALTAAWSGDEIRVAQGAYSPEGPLPDIRQASNPNPADGATGISRTADLSWTAGPDATSHDVYFGTSIPGMFQGNQTATTFDPGTMAYYTTYYWRIDEVSNGGKTTGTVWSFTTIMSPPPPPGGSSSDQAVDIMAGDREATFQLINGVAIYGGYAGVGEPDPNERDIDAYKTILSGDIGIPGDNSDNSYHVVTGSGTDATAVLDGFIITAGFANGGGNNDNGGGMVNSGGKPTLINCAFTDNYARGSGGGMNNWSSSPTVTNCTFNDNQAENGGGMYNYRSSPTVTNCTFSDNSCWNGGGMFNDSGSPTIANCTFSGNSADYGGGMRNYNSSPTLTNCTFTGNSANRDGGGMFNSEQGNPTLTNCTFTGNLTIYDGGAMCNRTSSPNVTNCKFSGNSANHGGGISNWPGSPTVTNCTFSRNSAELGGAVFNWDSSPLLANCIFSNNSAREWGGAICNLNASSPTLANCTFNGNSAMAGGGVYNQESSPTLTNCILWDDRPEEVYLAMGATAVITYSDVQGGWPGTGNINANPRFVEPGYWDPNEVWAEGDYHLLPGSPCIDAGTNTPPGGLPATDMDGNPRPLDGDKDGIAVADMGAYEFFNTPPVACIVSGNRIVEAEGPFGARVTLDGSCSSDADSTAGTNDDIVYFDWYKVDPCDPNADVFIGSGRIIDCNLSFGEHIIILEVFDTAGAFDVDEVTIVIQDTTSPVFTTIPQDLTVECDGNYNVAELNAWLAGVAAVDKYGSVTITNDFVGILNECGATGSATVTWTAEDESGNTATTPPATFTIVDTTPPVIICPADVTLECPADTSVEANGSATAGDTCGSVTITHSDQWQPTCGSAGTLTRTWTATDECGNSSTCAQTITVVDTTPPEFEFSVTPTVLWPPNHKMVLITPTWTVSDKCDATPEVSLVSISINESNTKGSGRTDDDIQISDDGSIYLRAERSGAGKDRVYTITYRAVDDCGNATESSATVTVPHDQR